MMLVNLLYVVLAMGLASYAAGKFASYTVRWLEDDLVDGLIDNNRARPIPGMERPDADIMRRLSDARWARVTAERSRETVAVLRGPRS